MFDAGDVRGPRGLVGVLAHAAGESLAATAQLDLSELTAGELRDTVRALEAVRRSLDATVGHALVELHDRDDTVAVGLATTRWLARDANLPPWVAKQRLGVPLKLRRLLPEVDAALTDGRIGFEHARVFADVVNVRNYDAFALVVPDLIDAAAHTGFIRWSRDVRDAAEQLDFDGSHDPADDLLANTLTLSPSDGFVMFRGELVGEHAVLAEEIIEARTDELYLRASRDREQFPDQQIPCRATLRAFALVELLRQALGVDVESTTGPRTDATIVIHPDLAPEDPSCPPGPPARDGVPVVTHDGRRLCAGVAGVLVCAGLLHVLVTSVTETGVPIAESDAYQPNRATRRAVQRRDGGCTFPGCGARVAWCDAHHVTPWPEGRTTTHNLILLCRHHHRLAHRNGWMVTLTDDGWTRWTSPAGHTRWGQRHGQIRAGP